MLFFFSFLHLLSLARFHRLLCLRNSFSLQLCRCTPRIFYQRYLSCVYRLNMTGGGEQDWGKYDLTYYLKGALAGGRCS